MLSVPTRKARSVEVQQFQFERRSMEGEGRAETPARQPGQALQVRVLGVLLRVLEQLVESFEEFVFQQQLFELGAEEGQEGGVQGGRKKKGGAQG